MLEHTKPSLVALPGIELALEHVNLVKPLSKKDLLDLQSECLDAPVPFRIRVKPASARNAIELTAIALHNGVDNWNFGSFIFQVDATKEGIANMHCGSLRDHVDSIEGAKVVQLAMAVLLRKATAIAEHFPESLAHYTGETFLNEP